MATAPPAVWNWLHLDLKGVVPSETKLLSWLDWFAQAGFNGIVWEYEDRLPWRSWPGTFRPGFGLDAWGRLWDRCLRLGLEIVPLVQTHGHLEWLLKHDAYAHLREAGHYNELCPHHEEAIPRITAWLDEVIALHPASRFLHLGADETWNLGACPRCKDLASQSADGRIAIYLKHVRRVCAHVIAQGRTPLIWVDMLRREGRLDLASQLPPETVLVDWHYNGPGPFASTRQFQGSGARQVMGGSAARNGHDPTRPLMLYPLVPRVENVLGWHRMRQDDAVAGLIHTNWSRGTSLGPLYGPWQGWSPAYVAAGRPDAWVNHDLKPFLAKVDAAMESGMPEACEAASGELPDGAVGDERACETLRWWRLALSHRALLGRIVRQSMLAGNHLSVRAHVGLDPHDAQALGDAAHRLDDDLRRLEREIRSAWREWELSDEDEYVAGRIEPLRRILFANML